MGAAFMYIFQKSEIEHEKNVRFPVVASSREKSRWREGQKGSIVPPLQLALWSSAAVMAMCCLGYLVNRMVERPLKSFKFCLCLFRSLPFNSSNSFVVFLFQIFRVPLALLAPDGLEPLIMMETNTGRSRFVQCICTMTSSNIYIYIYATGKF